jgi:hypothetical protein
MIFLLSFFIWSNKEFEEKTTFYISIIAVRKYKKSLDQLVETLPTQYKKVIIYQDEPEDSYQIQDNGDIIIYQVKNLMDYGQFPGLKYGFDNGLFTDDCVFLLLHTTMKLRGTSTESTQKIETLRSEMGDAHIYFITNIGQFNMCLIDKQGIEAVAPFYDDLNYIDKRTAIEYELHHVPGKSPTMANTIIKYHPTGVYPEGEPYKVYGGTDRFSTIIPSLNAVKHNLTFLEVDRTNGFEE